MSTTTYEMITSQILDALELGIVPWRKPWSVADAPRNLKSKKAYRGVNVFILGIAGYSSPWWLTFKQAKDLGGHVRKGEKGKTVVFWKWIAKKDDQDENPIPVLRYYRVFNVEQCEGIPAEKIPSEEPNQFDPIEVCEDVVAGYHDAPKIVHGGSRAFYRPSADTVGMPEPEAFESAQEYYSTLFHELGHSTGHDSRLARKGITDVAMFGSHDYSREELVAEMTAAFLSGHSGIDTVTLDNSAAYIGGWLKALKNDHGLVVTAAAQAQKAADHILGVTREEDSNG